MSERKCNADLWAEKLKLIRQHKRSAERTYRELSLLEEDHLRTRPMFQLPDRGVVCEITDEGVFLFRSIPLPRECIDEFREWFDEMLRAPRAVQPEGRQIRLPEEQSNA